jgi:hypothetical protein
MGIDTQALYGMIYAAEHGVNYKNTLMIGRQGVGIQTGVLKRILYKYNPAEPYAGKTDFAEDIFRYLGADTVDSLDYSDYEGAAIIHDMNIPVKEELKNKYSCVWDGGCLEHIFNYPVAIKNCMDMTKINGHLILHTPANNLFGHGFYQFSPELFFSLFHERNGFSETKIYMQNDNKDWFEVVSPHTIRKRVDICCSKKAETLMVVISKKVSSVPASLTVLQSDYVTTWNKKFHGGGKPGKIKRFVKKITPVFLHEKIHKIRRQALKNIFYIPLKQFQRQTKKRGSSIPPP